LLEILIFGYLKIDLMAGYCCVQVWWLCLYCLCDVQRCIFTRNCMLA